MVYAGCEYKGLTCFAAVAFLPPEIAGQWAYEASKIIVQQFLAMDDWADDGSNNGSIPRKAAETTTGAVPGGHTYSIDTYRDGNGCVLAERWLIHGMGHMWSQGVPADPPTTRDMVLIDPLGPDVSTPTIDFLLSHRIPETGTGCMQDSTNPH